MRHIKEFCGYPNNSESITIVWSSFSASLYYAGSVFSYSLQCFAIERRCCAFTIKRRRSVLMCELKYCVVVLRLLWLTYSVWYSQAVSHPSPDQAQHCLASEIRWDRVFSEWYGLKHKNNSKHVNTALTVFPNIFNLLQPKTWFHPTWKHSPSPSSPSSRNDYRPFEVTSMIRKYFERIWE